MTLSVMVVDDDRDDRYIVRRVVRKWDRDSCVEEVPDPVSALARLERGVMPDVVLLDINMPEMNGFEMLDELAARLAGRPGTPPVVVMLSSSKNARDIDRAKRAPFVVGYIEKPLRASDLDDIARRLAGG